MADGDFGFDIPTGDFSLGGLGSEGSAFPSGLSLAPSPGVSANDAEAFRLGLGGSGAAFPSGLNLGGSNFDMNLPSAPPTGPDSGFLDTAKGIWGSRSQVDPRTGQRTPGTGVAGAGESVLGGFSDFARGVMPVAQLGLAGLGVKSQLDAASASRDQSKQRQAMQDIQRQTIEPLRTFGTQQLSRAQAGQVDPAVQQMIDNWAQSAKVQAQQWFASQGLTDSTMVESIIRDIDQRALAMRANVLGMDKQQAMLALEGAMGGATAAAGQASQEEDQLNALIRQSNQALAALTGGTA